MYETEAIKAAKAAKAAQPEPWYIVGCLRCTYSGHSPHPPERCPNDGSILLRMDGLVAGWDVIDMARAVVDLHRAYEQVKRDRASAILAENGVRFALERAKKRAGA